MFTKTMKVMTFLALLSATPASAQAVFEEGKQPAMEFDGVEITLGGDFTQSFQVLSHTNRPTPASDANTLAEIGAGFNLAAANLTLTAQLSPGIKVVLENYLSSRHHNEFWAKGGYIQIDESPIAWLPLDVLMAMTTVKVGHYEVNYGDAHFRRSDNGNTLRNAFAENYILDAFTTEIGGEAIVRLGPFLAVAGVTSGQNKGDITRPDERTLAFLGKVGVDHRFGADRRVRLTASTYQNDDAGRATLYSGDRAGSAYWGVMDNASFGAFTNGRLNPNFTEEIRAWQLNPYVEFADLEVFGVAEVAHGRTAKETEIRSVRQLAVDGTYRLLDERAYMAARWNRVTGEMFVPGTDQQSDRVALAGGWFVTPNVLLKAEWVRQGFDGFATDHILREGQFTGVIFQGAVSF